MFSGDMTPEDSQRLSGWPSETESYQTCFLDAMQVFSDLEGLADDPEILAAADRLPDGSTRRASGGDQKARMGQGTQGQWVNKLGIALAATVLIATAIGFYQWRYSPEPETNILRYVTRVGEQKTVNLPDGSVVNLNTSSQILVDFSSDRRMVVLDRGEVYFDVVKNSAQPFTVELGDHAVTVLGTEFNIHRSPDKYTLALLEGSVSLHRRESPAATMPPHDFQKIKVDGNEVIRFKGAVQRLVSAGTVVEFNTGKQEFTAFAPDDMARYQGWRSGTVSFQSEPLYKVVLELNRYSAKKILIDGQGIRDLEVYAAVKVNRIDVALAVLEKALPIKVIHHFDRIVIVENDS